MSDEKSKKDIQTRLRRIEGQVKGIEKMVENESCCNDILIQVSAIRAAINKVGNLILKNYAQNCITTEENKDKVDEFIKILGMFLK